jgi:hypothetical protein
MARSVERAPDPAVRETGAGMRAVFLVGALLVAAAGFQLFVLTDHTDRFFAWTIKNPITAAFLGAFYLTALTLAALGWRERIWARARVGVLGVMAFVSLTLVATLMHLGQFHLHADGVVRWGAGYLWLAVYILAPLALAILWTLQLKEPGTDPPRERVLPRWYRAALGAHALVVVVVGVALFVSPSGAGGQWPWALTPLTARAIAAWLIGLGLVLAEAVYENAWERIRVATGSYVVLAALQFVVLARYPHGKGLDWGAAGSWIYLAFLATVLGIGAYGWAASRGARPDAEERRAEVRA